MSQPTSWSERIASLDWVTMTDELDTASAKASIATSRAWFEGLDRDTPWPDRLDDWLGMCHVGGQDRHRCSCATQREGGTPYTETQPEV